VELSMVTLGGLQGWCWCTTSPPKSSHCCWVGVGRGADLLADRCLPDQIGLYCPVWYTDAAEMKYFFNLLLPFLVVFLPWLIHCVEPFQYDTADFIEKKWSDSVADFGLALCAQKPLILLCEKQSSTISTGSSFTVSWGLQRPTREPFWARRM